MSSAGRVAAIVLNYNGLEVTLHALKSLLRMDYPSFEVVVVDNGSTDGSQAAITKAYPQVVVLRTEENLGPAGGCNLGLQWALKHRFDYALVLNNDIEVDATMLGDLVAAVEGDESIGCAGPKEYFFGDRDRIWSAGGELRFAEAITSERGSGEIDRGQFDRTEEVDYINGSAMLIRAEALRRTGPWDRLFHLAIEDADFCTRMKRLGYRCVYVPQARLWHRVSYRLGVYTPGKTFHTARSTALYVRRHGGPWNWITALFFILASLPIAFLRELPKGNQAAVVAKARGFIAGFRARLPPPPSWEPAQLDGEGGDVAG